MSTVENVGLIAGLVFILKEIEKAFRVDSTNKTINGLTTVFATFVAGLVVVIMQGTPLLNFIPQAILAIAGVSTVKKIGGN